LAAVPPPPLIVPSASRGRRAIGSPRPTSNPVSFDARSRDFKGCTAFADTTCGRPWVDGQLLKRYDGLLANPIEDALGRVPAIFGVSPGEAGSKRRHAGFYDGLDRCRGHRDGNSRPAGFTDGCRRSGASRLISTGNPTAVSSATLSCVDQSPLLGRDARPQFAPVPRAGILLNSCCVSKRPFVGPAPTGNRRITCRSAKQRSPPHLSQADLALLIEKLPIALVDSWQPKPRIAYCVATSN